MALCESWLHYKIQYNLHTLKLSQPVSKNVYNMPHLPPGVFVLLLQKPSSVIIHTPSIWNFCIYLKLGLFCCLLYDTISIPGWIVLMTWWLVKWMQRGSDHGLMKVLSWNFPWGYWEKPWKPIRQVVVPAEIQTEHLPNTGVEC